MEFFEAVDRRRSIRRYKPDPVPPELMDRALDAAILAPNSSNMQTWRFYWVNSPEKKKLLAHACLGQGAAATAAEMVVFVADPSAWKVGQKEMLHVLKDHPRKDFQDYYKKLMPFLYSFRILAPFKWLIFNCLGLFKPFARHPWSSKDIEMVCVKSCALACENFMLATAALGLDSCPMEGFDEARVKKLLRLSCRARVVMVISVGYRDERGLWGERVRLARDKVVFKV